MTRGFPCSRQLLIMFAKICSHGHLSSSASGTLRRILSALQAYCWLRHAVKQCSLDNMGMKLVTDLVSLGRLNYGAVCQMRLLAHQGFCSGQAEPEGVSSYLYWLQGDSHLHQQILFHGMPLDCGQKYCTPKGSVTLLP